MSTMDTLVARAQEISDELDELASLDALDETQDARFDELTDEARQVAADIAKHEARQKARDEVRTAIESGKARVEHGDDRSAPQFMKRTETDVDVRTASRGEARSAALKVAETKGRNLAGHQQEYLETLVSTNDRRTSGDYIARRLLITETDAYKSAFTKGLSRANPIFTDEERNAVLALQELEAREQTLTDGEGGYGVPVLIDPTIILTSGASGAPVVDIATKLTITTDAWKGVSSAGATSSYDSELSETSDDSPSYGQPSIDMYTMRTWLPFSIEIGMDYPGFANQMQRVINNSRTKLLAAQSITGSTPVGLFTAIDATAGSEVSVTTAGQLHALDALKLWDQLPAYYKNDRTYWVSSTKNLSDFRRTANDNGLFTVDLTEGGITRLIGKPVIETDFAPSFTAGTTSDQNIMVVGDFTDFYFVQRAGLTIEYVPHVFGSTNNAPTGQRGLFAWGRHGFDSVNDAAFRLLKNP